MKIYIMRHGEADPEGKDNERQLSKQGRQDVSQLARFIKPLQLTVTHSFHSEKIRAIETSAIMLTAMHTIHAPLARPDLDPNADIDSMISELTQLTGDVLLVGHLP